LKVNQNLMINLHLIYRQNAPQRIRRYLNYSGGGGILSCQLSMQYVVPQGDILHR